MLRHASALAVAALLPAAALAQGTPATPAATPAAAPARAALTAEQQIAAAVLPLPEHMRAGATVLGYASTATSGAAGGAPALSTLRRGTNAMICLAPDPQGEQFHVACYHRALEPFMARGRALRRSGVKGEQVDSARFREIAQGKLQMPKSGGMLYTLTGGTFDPAAGTAEGARFLYVMYLPGATEASSGISAVPSRTGPWLMFPGTPKAHIMFTGQMR